MATVKVQTWADDLRLPCFVNAAETAGLLSSLDHLRKPAIPFQSKHVHALKRGLWYVLRRPADRARTGLLCVWPEQRCCAYISGEPPSVKRPTPRVALLRLRIDPQFFGIGSGMTVFAATLSATARRLWVEDTLIWKGRAIQEEESFSQRYQRAVQWLEHYAIMDSRLIDGIEIEMARWQALSAVEPDGTWELQSDEVGRRRLYWIANHAPAEYHSPTLAALPSPSPAVPSLDLGVASGPLVAIATRETGPEQWALASADGVSLGRLLVRTLTLSTELRSVKGNTARMEVVWNAAFGKWEARGQSTGLASHSSAFASTK